MGDIFGTKKASKRAAEATITAAQLTADNDAQIAADNRISADAAIAATNRQTAIIEQDMKDDADWRQSETDRNITAANETRAWNEKIFNFQVESADRQFAQIGEMSLKQQQAAERAAKDAREGAQAAQLGRESSMAQERAMQAAQLMLQDKNAVAAPVDVALAEGTGTNGTSPEDVDPTTGRKRSKRAKFMSTAANSGGGLSI